MDSLKGMKLLIGKDKCQGGLMVAVTVNEQTKTAIVGSPNSVPSCVSRCQPDLGIAHCSIDIDKDGKMVITNLKQLNITYVGGSQVVSKSLDENSDVELGANKYKLPISLVLQTAQKIVSPKPSAPELSLLPLKAVWDNYCQEEQRIRQGIKERQDFARIPPIFTSSAGLLTALTIVIEGVPNWIRAIGVMFTFIGIIMFIIMYVLAKRDNSQKELEALNDKLIDDYVCPNPACHHFMGKQPYKVLKQNKKCPFCGCKYK